MVCWSSNKHALQVRSTRADLIRHYRRRSRLCCPRTASCVTPWRCGPQHLLAEQKMTMSFSMHIAWKDASLEGDTCCTSPYLSGTRLGQLYNRPSRPLQECGGYKFCRQSLGEGLQPAGTERLSGALHIQCQTMVHVTVFFLSVCGMIPQLHRSCNVCAEPDANVACNVLRTCPNPSSLQTFLYTTLLSTHRKTFHLKTSKCCTGLKRQRSTTTSGLKMYMVREYCIALLLVQQPNAHQ